MIRQWTKEQDSMIITEYGRNRYAVQELLKKPQFQFINKSAISYRARKLGVIRSRSILLSEEREIIRDNAGDKSVMEIIRLIERRTGKRRSYNVVSSSIRRIVGISIKPDRYSIRDLMIGFRVSDRKIYKWVKEGKLKGSRDADKPGSDWRFRPSAVAEFIIKHPFELEGSAVDIPWVVSLILEFASRIRKSERIVR
jgi:hypothetical protein